MADDREIDILEDVDSATHYSGTLHCGNLTEKNPDGTTGPCHEGNGFGSGCGPALPATPPTRPTRWWSTAGTPRTSRSAGTTTATSTSASARAGSARPRGRRASTTGTTSSSTSRSAAATPTSTAIARAPPARPRRGGDERGQRLRLRPQARIGRGPPDTGSAIASPAASARSRAAAAVIAASLPKAASLGRYFIPQSGARINARPARTPAPGAPGGRPHRGSRPSRRPG